MTWEYIAGFFDGEGNVRINSSNDSRTGVPRFTLRASVAQAGDRGHKILTEIKEFLAKAAIESEIYTDPHSDKANWLEGHALTIGKRNCVEKFIQKILPFSRVKKTEAQDILRFSKIFPKMKYGMNKGDIYEL